MIFRIRTSRVKHTFVDANIFLLFYSLGEDGLTELDKLRAAAAAGQLRIYVNQWVLDEIERNRERTISDTLNRFEEQRIETRIPRVAEGLKGFDELRKSFGKCSNEKKALTDAIVHAAAKRELHADHLIEALLEKSTHLEVNETIITAARSRCDKGDPPGKENKLNDRVHWECLLQHAPNDIDLILVTGDKDFRSPLNKSKPNAFLEKEWGEKKEGNLELHSTLKSFLTSHFPDIDVAEIDDRLEAVSNLVNSGSFASTHQAVGKLSGFTGFSANEVDSMLQAIYHNQQVGWIVADPDVAKFYIDLLRQYGHVADLSLREKTIVLLTSKSQVKGTSSDDDEVPF